MVSSKPYASFPGCIRELPKETVSSGLFYFSTVHCQSSAKIAYSRRWTM